MHTKYHICLASKNGGKSNTKSIFNSRCDNVHHQNSETSTERDPQPLILPNSRTQREEIAVAQHRRGHGNRDTDIQCNKTTTKHDIEHNSKYQTSRQQPVQCKRPKDGFHIVHGPVATLTLSALHFPIKNEMESVQCAMDSDR